MRAQATRLRLAERGVVAFAEVDWRGTWYSRHQLLSRLARTCPVVVVGDPLEAREVVTGRAPARPVLERIAPNLWDYRPPRLLPRLYRPAVAGRLLDRLRARHLEASVRSLGMTDPVHYAFHPQYVPMLELLPRRTTVYHCYDKYDAYQDAPAETVRALEQALVARSDLVLASSRILARDIEERTGHPVHHLPHAVDFEFFRDGARQETPADLASLPRPRIGYIARIDERVDDDALREISRKRPDASVVIIGRIDIQSPERAARFRELCALPNVHALGAKPREAIPAYTAGLDVCLLCYRNDNWGRYVQPIKAYEYLACGRPVVSAPIDAARDFGDLVQVAPGPGRWVEVIEAALAADSPDARARRIEFARENSWDRRATELIALIDEKLA
jgi:glycosyltransferase involved in cell wall biosynthesis